MELVDGEKYKVTLCSGWVIEGVVHSVPKNDSLIDNTGKHIKSIEAIGKRFVDIGDYQIVSRSFGKRLVPNNIGAVVWESTSEVTHIEAYIENFISEGQYTTINGKSVMCVNQPDGTTNLGKFRVIK